METESKVASAGGELSVVNFADALQSVINNMTTRSQEIIFSRYGITGKKKMTLEEIGNKYGITRERVRQVIREVFKKVKEMKGDPEFAEVGKRIRFTIEKNSGIIKETDLVELLGKGSSQQRGASRFFLECLEDINALERKGELFPSYSAKEFDLENWRKVKNIALDVLKKEAEPLSENEFFEKVSKVSLGLPLDSKMFFDYLAVSEEIMKNNFGKWGITKWKEVTPKGTREKAYLVLKEAKKPLHFKTIAEQIDAHKLNKKKTHAQTVHNELIKDSKFVLVGRGMYALGEWGYEKGTVKDVISEILGKTGVALSKEEVVSQVLKRRSVKKSTIVINLNNFFKKTEDGKYAMMK